MVDRNCLVAIYIKKRRPWLKKGIKKARKNEKAKRREKEGGCQRLK